MPFSSCSGRETSRGGAWVLKMAPYHQTQRTRWYAETVTLFDETRFDNRCPEQWLEASIDEIGEISLPDLEIFGMSGNAK